MARTQPRTNVVRLSLTSARSKPQLSRVVAVGVPLGIAAFFVSSFVATSLDGSAGATTVIDGDTLHVGTARVRLYGIDAPELAQRCKDQRQREWACGESAKVSLQKLVAGKSVECDGRGQDDYGRVLAVCTADGREINTALVEQGLAWAFVRYSSAYVATEQGAKSARRGVFAAENTPPWDFRADRWSGATRTADGDQARKCPIKGNISRSGERIYHLPWQSSYNRTGVNEGQGERWFCDEGEAERAGWRKAR